MELVNEASDIKAKVSAKNSGLIKCLNEAAEAIVVLLAPLVPHITETMWQNLGKSNSIFKCKWPLYDKNVIVEKVVTIAIQINGKLRSKIEVNADINNADLKAAVLSDSKIKNWVGEKAMRDFIIVPKKLVNIVL